MIIVDFTEGHKVWIYKRTPEQVAEAIESEANGFEGKFAGWWPTEKRSLDGETTTRKTRSKEREYFIFWPYSPIYGYYLTHIGKEHNPNTKAPWSGVFIDVVNGATYDTTGRPLDPNMLVENKLGIKEVNKLTKISLMIPKHEFSNDGKTVTLIC